VVLYSIKENYFHSAFEDRIAVYVARRIFWRRWQPKLRKFYYCYYYYLFITLFRVIHTGD
jgi:hypothetical protein